MPRIKKSEAIEIASPIDRSVADNFIDFLDGYRNRTSIPDVVVTLTTTGGSRPDAMRIYEAIASYREAGGRIKLRIVGSADSAALIIFLAFPKEDRSMSPGSTLVIHSGQFKDVIELDGNSSSALITLEKLISEIKGEIEAWNYWLGLLADELHMERSEVAELAETNWTISSIRASELGLLC